MTSPLRVGISLAGLALAAGSGVALRLFDESRRPEKLAYEALNGANADPTRAVSLYRDALIRDPANPYRWADLATALSAADDGSAARYCFSRALEVSGDIPAIWLRDANFHFQLGEAPKAMETAVRVLNTVPDYDEVLFNYFDRLVGGPSEILPRIGDNRRAVRAYSSHLVQTGQLDAATEAWRFANGKHFTEQAPTILYIHALLGARPYSTAQDDWAAFLGPAAGDFPESNRLFNGGFERELTQPPPAHRTATVLDWRIDPAAPAETVRDSTVARTGTASLRIRFNGEANVDYSHVRQLAVVKPGPYVLEAWIKTEDLTTDQGIRIEVVDAEVPARLTVRSGSLTGTHDWTHVIQQVTIPGGTQAVEVRALRLHSDEFNSRIRGTAWIDDVRLAPHN